MVKAPEIAGRTTLQVAPVRIEQVKATKIGTRVEVALVATAAFSCTPFRLSEPERLVLDCPSTRLAPQAKGVPVDSSSLRAIRIAQFKPDTARIVLDLTKRESYEIQTEGNTLLVRIGEASQGDAGHPSSGTPKFVSTPPTPSSKAVDVARDASRAAQTVLIPTPAAAPVPSAPIPQSPPDNHVDSATSHEDSPVRTSSDPLSAEHYDAQPENPGTSAPAEAQRVRVSDDYVIGTQDVLAIDVWQEPELSKVVPVRPDGKITLPLVGDVVATGRTPRELQSQLSKQLDSYVRRPRVTVIVQEVNSQKFYVIGQVQKPGSYPLGTHVAILDALAMAGGFRDFAKVQRIYLLRLAPDGTRQRVAFDYKAAVNGKNAYREIELRSGDTVVVP